MVHQATKNSFFSMLSLAGLLLGGGIAGATPSPTHPGGPGEPFAGLRATQEVLGAAVLNVDTGMTFASIQAAINAASAGDTLEIQVANLPEGQVLVDRSLTLRGQTGTEVVSMAVDTGTSGDNRAWFLVNAGVDLQVRDLTFDGTGRLVWQAFRHRGTGSFESCRFQNIQYNPSVNYQGTAIVVLDSGDLEVRNCTFENVGRVGMLAFGAGVTSTVFENNTYIGKGGGDWLDYGFEVGGGASATATGNSITACLGVASADGSTSAGMLASTFFGAGTQLQVTSNLLLGNTTGLAVGFNASDTTAATAAFNRIFDNGSSGIRSDSTTAVTAENNWWGCNDGPGAAGCDGILGSGAVDGEPWLILSLSAAPPTLPLGGTSLLTARVTENSDGADTAGLGTIPDGTEILFDGAGLGPVAPPQAGTVTGLATSQLTAQNPGFGDVAAALDNQVVTTPVEILGVVAIPALGPFGLLVLAAALALAGLWLRKRTPGKPGRPFSPRT